MKNRFAYLFIVVVTLCLLPSAWAEEPTPAPAPAPDVVTLKDGSVIYGEVIGLENGELQIKTAFGVGDIVKVKWANVATLSVKHPLPFHLKQGTILVATAEAGEEGTLVLKAEPLEGTMSVPMDSIVSVNPLVQPPVVFLGAVTAGLSSANGNSDFLNASFLFDLTGRSEKLRLLLNGRYVYNENNNQLAARNARGTIKLDFFFTKRFYAFTSAFFEQDTFQDLKLRTALSAGPGYQFIDKGDFSSPYFKDMTLSGEFGIGYFNEDFNNLPDQASMRGRGSLRFNWPMLDERIVIYYFGEFFPSFQNTHDFYLTTDQGIRFKLLEGFVANLQYTYRYNNNPPAGVKSTDTLTLITFGYNFDTANKR
jgi:putative salt-induced outer membrane protein YdiY